MQTFKRMITKGVVTLAMAGLALAVTPGTAQADFLDFQVDEGTVPGAEDNIFTADKLNGDYSEVIVLNGDGTFDASLYVNFSNYLANEGVTDPADQLGNFFDAQYGMYALVTATGTFSGTGTAADPFKFEPTDADATLRLDPDSDTTHAFGVPGGPITLGSDTDDYTIMSATTIDQASSFGELISQGDPEDQGGFYNLVFTDPSLTADGALYWFDLSLFGLRAINDGDFDDANISDGTLTGDVSLVFAQEVPEPASLSLLGLGLIGASMAARRRRNQK